MANASERRGPSGCAVAAIGCSVLALVLVIGSVVWIGLFFRQKLPDLAEELAGMGGAPTRAVGVYTGAGLLTKATWYEDSSLALVTDLTSGKLTKGQGDEIGAASERGAVFLGLDGQRHAVASYSAVPNVVIFADIEGDGQVELINTGSWGRDPALLKHDGTELWHYSNSMGVNDMAAGDVDGDGELEFAVGCNGGGGVHLLDSQGREKWHQPDSNVWRVAVFDTDGDGLAEVVNSNAGGELTIRKGADGSVIRQSQVAAGAYFSDFGTFVSQPSGEVKMICSGDGEVLVLSRDGSSVTALPYPPAASLGHTVGCEISFDGGKTRYLAAVVTSDMGAGDANLCLFDETSTLVYDEVLDGPAGAVAAIRLAGHEVPSLLVGGDGQVWAFDWREPAAE